MTETTLGHHRLQDLMLKEVREDFSVDFAHRASPSKRRMLRRSEWQVLTVSRRSIDLSEGALD